MEKKQITLTKREIEYIEEDTKKLQISFSEVLRRLIDREIKTKTTITNG